MHRCRTPRGTHCGYAGVCDDASALGRRSTSKTDFTHELANSRTTAERMRQAWCPPSCGGVLNRLRRAALRAFFAHSVAAFGMLLVLRHGLETTPELQDRLAFLVNHRAPWTLAWLSWTAAAFSILYFYTAFSDAHRVPSRF